MKDIIFGLIGGLGLFIFGMKYLSDGLQKVAGTKLRRTLRSLTQNRFRGVALGTFVTSLIQSSSVTTVILVGLINAGIISLMQGASVVIGANIGTTITAQIIAFKISKYALPAIGIGVAVLLIAKKKKTQFWGQVLLAFGLVFLGLSTMSGVMKPLKDIPAVTDFFVSLSSHPVLAVLLGTVFTITVQSSSASIGMTIALASVGLIDFRAALFLILGDNIGTTVTVWLASIGGSISAKRMACFHTFFNIIGAAYFYFLIYYGVYPRFIDWITPGDLTPDTIARHIANAHSAFNIINGLIFVFIMGPVVRLIETVIPGEDIYIKSEFKYLQDKLLSSPEIAVESSKKELYDMGQMVKKTLACAVEGFFNGDKRSIPYVQTQESAIDHLQHDITFYLAKLSAQELTTELAQQIPPLLHSINDFERIADHAINIAELTEKRASEQIKFTNNAQVEIRSIYAKVEDMFDEALKALSQSDPKSADRVMRTEGEVNYMQREFLNAHSRRLCSRKCQPQSALVFVDFINNIEKIGDHLTNITQASRRDFVYGEYLNGDHIIQTETGLEPSKV